MKPTATIRIYIKNIKVDDEYYSFDWVAAGLGKKRSDHYESDYENGMTPGQWRKELEKGYAVQIVLQQIAE